MLRKTEDEKKEEELSVILPSLNQSSSFAMPCENGVCPVRPAMSFSTASPVEKSFTPIQLIGGPISTKKTEESGFTADVYNLFLALPPDLLNMMKEAAARGLLTSFLLTLTEQFLTEYLQSRHYSKGQIDCVNQVVRVLSLLVLGISWETALMTPLGNFLLTECIGMNKENANYLMAGAAVGVSILNSPMSILGTSLVMGAGIGASVLGGEASKQIFHLAKNSFFSVKNLLENQLTSRGNLATEGCIKFKLD